MTDPNSMYLNLQLSFPAVSQHYIIFVLFYRKPVLWIHQDVGPIWFWIRFRIQSYTVLSILKGKMKNNFRKKTIFIRAVYLKKT